VMHEQYSSVYTCWRAVGTSGFIVGTSSCNLFQWYGSGCGLAFSWKRKTSICI